MSTFTISKGFTAQYDLKTGESTEVERQTKRLSQMRGMFADAVALETAIAKEDAVIYDVYPVKPPADEGDLASGTSILYPGKIGDEYYFTKGHFHNILMTAEVYFGMAGEGLMLLENKEGDWGTLPIVPGATVYVPKGYAHRTVNTGCVPLVTYFCFRSDAGQDYGSMEKKGYRKLIVDREGKPAVIDNPRWV